MEKIYLSANLLKTLHYTFFYFAVFSFTLGLFFIGFFPLESLSFLLLSIFYTISSFVSAYYFYKDYKIQIEMFKVIKLYLPNYMIITFLTIFSLLIMITITPSLFALIYSFVFINYYTFFITILGLIFSRLNFVSKIFEVYNYVKLYEANKIVKNYALTPYVYSYKIGSDPKLDAILEEVIKHKEYPFLM